MMRGLMAVGLFAALIATSVAAEKPKAEPPTDGWSDDFDKRFADFDLWNQKPKKEKVTVQVAPSQAVEKDDQGKDVKTDDADEGSLANVLTTDDKSRSGSVSKHLPAELVELIWKMIDKNGSGSATDHEAATAIKRLRVAINSKKSFPLRDLARASLGMADDAILSREDTIVLIARVRGIKCPTAARAKRYFDQLDQDGSNTIDSAEIMKRLSKLGAMGRYLAGILAPTLQYIDLNDDHAIDLNEAYYSANILLRLQLVSEGNGLANRNPLDWMQVVSAVATLDLDADNTVSRFESIRVRSLATDFNRIDRNHDQQLSASELSDYQEYLQRMAAKARKAAIREQQERMRTILAIGRSSGGKGNSRKRSSRRPKGCLT